MLTARLAARDRWSWLALGAGALFAVVTTVLTWTEHATYNSTSLDIGVYTQLVWNMAHGHPFETTLLLQNRLHLAEHIALLLQPLAPLYGLAPDVRILLLLQQTALGLSGLPVYWLARRRLNGPLALLVVLGYYLMPALTEVALDAFYPIVLAALPVGLASAWALSGRPRSAALAVLLAMLWEEEAALLAIGLGLYLLVRCRPVRRLGLAVLVAAVLWLGLAEGLVMPRYQQPSTAGQDTRAQGHFEQLRAQPLGWLGNVALNRLDPDLVRTSGLVRRFGQLAPCQQPGQCSALRWWLYPTGGLALLSPPTLLMAAPEAATVLIADKPGRFRRHWVAPMLPVIWLAVALGLALLARRRLQLGAAGLLLAAMLVFYYLDSSLPLGSQYEATDVVMTPLGEDLARLGAMIPDGASVLATRRGLAHLTNRRFVYVYPPRDYGAGLWPPAALPDYALIDLRGRDSADLLAIETEGRYHEVARTPNAVLLRRGQ